MKRVFILGAIPIFLLGAPLFAQDATGDTNAVMSVPSVPSSGNTAAAIAAKEAAEDRYQTLQASLQALQTDNEDLHSKIAALQQDIAALREAQSHAADNSGIQDQLKHLADAIQAVDKARLKDKDEIAEEIRDSIGGLQKSLGNTSAPPAPERPARTKPVATADDSPAPAVDGFSYTIHDGDRLDLIVKAYNADYRSKGWKTITIRQAKEANPNVNWNRLLVGQKIIIPKPAGQ